MTYKRNWAKIYSCGEVKNYMPSYPAMMHALEMFYKSSTNHTAPCPAELRHVLRAKFFMGRGGWGGGGGVGAT
jgi:hypothetical protein